jgi:hypothetical protein
MFGADDLRRRGWNPEIEYEQRLLLHVVLEFGIDMKSFHASRFSEVAAGKARC